MGPHTPSGDPRLSQAVERDLRIDFFRGVALLVIFVNHIALMLGNPYLKVFSWRMWGVSGGAELFVFFSGYVFALVYSRRLLNRSFLSGQLKALSRFVQLYAANLCTLAIVVVLCFFAVESNRALFELYGVEKFFLDFAGAAKDAVFLDSYPLNFDILPLYLTLLPFMPAVLWLLLRHRTLALSLSLALYTLSHFFIFPDVFGHSWGMRLYFNPLSWQFLFVSAMALAVMSRREGFRVAPHPTLITAAAAFIAAVFVWRVLYYWIEIGLPGHHYLPAWLPKPSIVPLARAGNLEPLRLVHFFSLVYLVSLATRKHSSFWQGPLARPVVRCGQNSLFTFCFGLGLAYSMALTVQALDGGTLTGIFLSYGSLPVLLLAASGVHSLKRTAGSPARPPPKTV